MGAHRVSSPEDPHWKAIEAEFRRKGFLSPSIGEFRTHFRIVMKDWFELADALNELAQRLYTNGTRQLAGKSVLHPVALGLQMMPRCLGGFQAAVLLCELGMGPEAQMLIRSIYETAFWLGYVNRDPDNAIPQLERETLESEIGFFGTATRHLPSLPAATAADAQKQLSQMRERCASLPKPPSIEQLASLGGYPQSYFFYRELSGAATHMSLKSISTFLSHNEDGQVVGHQIGPDEKGVGKAIWLATRSMIIAVDALQQLLETTEYDNDLQRLNNKMESLGPWEPASA